jgi:hypothetical protein
LLLRISGYMLGGQIGCDYQFSPHWVAGIEGAATGGNIHGSTGVATPGLLGDSATFRETTDLLTSNALGIELLEVCPQVPKILARCATCSESVSPAGTKVSASTISRRRHSLRPFRS